MHKRITNCKMLFFLSRPSFLERETEEWERRVSKTFLVGSSVPPPPSFFSVNNPSSVVHISVPSRRSRLFGMIEICSLGLLLTRRYRRRSSFSASDHVRRPWCWAVISIPSGGRFLHCLWGILFEICSMGLLWPGAIAGVLFHSASDQVALLCQQVCASVLRPLLAFARPWRSISSGIVQICGSGG